MPLFNIELYFRLIFWEEATNLEGLNGALVLDEGHEAAEAAKVKV